MANTSDTTDVLDLFFSPRRVAIVGLSRAALSSPVSVLTTLKDFGYDGDIVVINPKMDVSAEDGIFPSLDDVPDQVDLAVITVARAHVLDVLRACVRNRIRAAVIITQGFADADEEGQRLQEEMLALVRESDTRILGPNTIGVSNAFANFTSSFIEVHNDKTPVGIVSQSGLFIMGHNIINNEPAGFSMAADLGNASDISIDEVIDYYGRCPEIQVIQCHVEGIRDGAAFVRTAERVSQDKPIIMLKAGRSQQGQVAVASHSGAAAGETQIYTAAFRKAGLVQADDAEELRLLSKAFVTYRPPRGRRVAIMSYSGGGAILAIDAIEEAGLELAKVSESTIAAISNLFPDWIGVDNPFDVWIPISRDLQSAFPRILEAILEDDGVDAVICIYCSYTLPKYQAYDCTAHIAAIAGKYPDKPIACWSYGIDIAGFTGTIEKDGTAMVFPSLGAAATTLAKLAHYREYRDRAPAVSAPSAVSIDASAVAQIMAQAQPGPSGYLFTETLDVLQRCGVTVAPWRIAQREDELVQVAADLNYPLCLKVISSDIVHKSDSGGLRLGIADETGLIDAWRAIRQDVARFDEAANIDGVLVQEMAGRGMEVMIGAKRDPIFGPCMILGTGGIYTEILNDYAFRLAPVSVQDGEEMIDELRLAPLLRGARGATPCNLQAIAEAISRVSGLMLARPEIVELDINPLIVDDRYATAVDARMFLAPTR